MGDPLEIHCSVNTADITNSDDVTISWTGPNGTTITNDSRLTITPTVSNGTNHISTLQFSYLSEDDEGLYECSTSVLGYDENKTASVELVNFTSKHYLNVFVLTLLFYASQIIILPSYLSGHHHLLV